MLNIIDCFQHQKTNEGRMDPALMGTPRNMDDMDMAEGKARVKPFPTKQAFDQNDPNTWGKTSRNAPCPCGSGKKYKHCHGRVS